LWVGRGERRDPKANKVGFPHRNGTGSAKRNNCGRGDRAEPRIGARGRVGRGSDGRPVGVRRHLSLAARWRGSLDLVAQQRQANRQHLAAQQQRGD